MINWVAFEVSVLAGQGNRTMYLILAPTEMFNSDSSFGFLLLPELITINSSRVCKVASFAI